MARGGAGGWLLIGRCGAWRRHGAPHCGRHVLEALFFGRGASPSARGHDNGGCLFPLLSLPHPAAGPGRLRPTPPRSPLLLQGDAGSDSNTGAASQNWPWRIGGGSWCASPPVGIRVRDAGPNRRGEWALRTSSSDEAECRVTVRGSPLVHDTPVALLSPSVECANPSGPAAGLASYSSSPCPTLQPLPRSRPLFSIRPAARAARLAGGLHLPPPSPNPSFFSRVGTSRDARVGDGAQRTWRGDWEGDGAPPLAPASPPRAMADGLVVGVCPPCQLGEGVITGPS